MAKLLPNRQPYPPTPEPAPAPAPLPVVVFANPEAAATVTGPLRERYEHAVSYASTEWDQARGCQTDIDKAAQEIRDAEELIKQRKQFIERRSLEKQQHMVHGQQGCDVANPAAELLGMAGVHVQKIFAPTIEPAPPVLRPADMKAHPLDTSTPLSVVQDASQGSSMDNPPAGHCIRCGEQVWRTKKTESSPNGVTHGWGATCDPNAEEPEYADLGEGREVAS